MRISDWSSDVCSSDLAGAGVKLDRVWLTDVRSYESAEILLAPGLTALLGDNGQGKTNVLEAIAWLATLSSFRGAPTDAMIRQGAQQAIIRAEGEREGRSILIEAELVGSGRNRALVNRQPLKRAREITEEHNSELQSLRRIL